MKTILSIDPGKITGLSWGSYSGTGAYMLENFKAMEFDELSSAIWHGKLPWANVLVIERFVPQSGAEYALKEGDLAGVEVIGMLRHGLIPDYNEVYWQLRSEKGLVPDRVLKDNGMWKTGKDVNWDDGRDVNDATIHGIAWLFKREHLPTLRAYFHK